MKKDFSKSKSFTLIELLVAVAIFTVVSVLVIATLSMLVSSKSKTVGNNELKTEGGKILVEIQDMIEKGNGSTVPGANQPGVIVFKDNTTKETACTNFSDGIKLGSYQTDYRRWTINRTLRYDAAGKQILETKDIYNDAGVAVASKTDVKINSDRVDITNFVISGKYRSSACGTQAVATNLKITLTVTSKSQGTPSDLTLTSTFTSEFPYPDKGQDSVPPVY